MIPDNINTDPPQNRPNNAKNAFALYHSRNAQRLIQMIDETIPMNEPKKQTAKPCGCEIECGGYPHVQSSMRVDRYTWNGCRNSDNKIFLWSVNHRSHEVKGDLHRWERLFNEPEPIDESTTEPEEQVVTVVAQQVQAPAYKPDLFATVKPNIFGVIE
jgi:hypothetical protein